MADIEEVKKQRSSSKRKLTILINKLKTSLQYGDPNFKTHYLSLVAEQDTLVDLNLQIVELEDKDNAYLSDITSSYENVLEMYFSSLKEDESIKKAKKLSQITDSVELSIVNLQSVLESSKIILSNDTDALSKKGLSSVRTK